MEGEQISQPLRLCKGPGARTSREHWRNRKKASVARTWTVKPQMARNKAREEKGDLLR